MILNPLYSLYKSDFYRRGARSSWSNLLTYLLCLGILYACVSTVIWSGSRPAAGFYDLLDQAGRLPPIIVKDGSAESTLEGPVILESQHIPGFRIKFDLSRTSPVTLDEMKRDGLYGYCARDRGYWISAIDRISEFKHSEGELGISKLLKDRKIFLPAVVVYFLVLFLTWLIGVAPIQFLVCWSVGKFTSINLPANELIKLSIFSQTPIFILRILLQFIPADIPGFVWIGLLINISFGIFAIRSQQDASASAT